MILELVEEVKRLNTEDLLQRAAKVASRLVDKCCDVCSYNMEKGTLASQELLELTGGIIKYNLNEYGYNYYYALARLFDYEGMSMVELKQAKIDLFDEDKFKTLLWIAKFSYQDDDRIIKPIDYVITLFRVVDLEPDMEFLQTIVNKIGEVLDADQENFREISDMRFEVKSGFSIAGDYLNIGAIIENNSDYSFEMGQVLVGVSEGVDLVFHDTKGHYRIDAHSRVPFGVSYKRNDDFVPTRVILTAMPVGVNPGADYTLPHMDVELLNVKYDDEKHKITGIIKNVRKEKIVFGLSAVALDSDGNIIGGYQGVHNSGTELDSYFELDASIDIERLSDIEIRAIAIEPVK